MCILNKEFLVSSSDHDGIHHWRVEWDRRGTARVLAATGAKLVLRARRTDKLGRFDGEIKASGDDVRTRALDVTILDDVQV